MSDYILTHFHVGSYKKTTKMNVQMLKELQKAVRARSKEVKSTITNEKVTFEERKDEIVLADIAKVRRNREHRIIVVAMKKVEKNRSSHIFGLRFHDDDDFYRFFDQLSRPMLDDRRMERSVPIASEPPSGSANVERHARSPSTVPSTSEMRSRTMDSSLILFENPATCHASNSSTISPKSGKRTSLTSYQPRSSYIQTPKESILSPPQSKLSFFQKSGTLLPPKNLSAVTYVTTDVLPPDLRSNSPRRKSKITPKDVYPVKRKTTVKRKEKGHTYAPDKGVIRSTEGNVYLYTRAKGNAFTNVPSSPSLPSLTSLSSSPTSTTESLKKTRLFRVVRITRLNSTSSGRSSSSSSSSSRSTIRRRGSARSTSSSSSSSCAMRVKRVNVWKYQNRGESVASPSSGSTDTTTVEGRIDRRKSRPRSAECQVSNVSPPEQIIGS